METITATWWSRSPKTIDCRMKSGRSRISVLGGLWLGVRGSLITWKQSSTVSTQRETSNALKLPCKPMTSPWLATTHGSCNRVLSSAWDLQPPAQISCKVYAKNRRKSWVVNIPRPWPTMIFKSAKSKSSTSQHIFGLSSKTRTSRRSLDQS